MKCPCWKQQRRKERRKVLPLCEWSTLGLCTTIEKHIPSESDFSCLHASITTITPTPTHCVYSSWRWKLTEGGGGGINQEPIFCPLSFKEAKYNPNLRLHPVTFKNRPRSRNFHKTIQTGLVILQHFCTWFHSTWSKHYDDRQKLAAEMWPWNLTRVTKLVWMKLGRSELYAVKGILLKQCRKYGYGCCLKFSSFWTWNNNFVRKYSLQLHLYRTAASSRLDEAFSNWLKCVQVNTDHHHAKFDRS